MYDHAVKPLAESVGLDCSLLAGQESIEREAAHLRPPPLLEDMNVLALSGVVPYASATLDTLPLVSDAAIYSNSNDLHRISVMQTSAQAVEEDSQEYLMSMLLGESGVDLCVATPGRLMQHLQRGNLDVRNLQFLIVDEADRLLRQSYQEWLPRLLEAAEHQNKHSYSLLSRQLSKTKSSRAVSFCGPGLDRSSKPERGWQTDTFRRVHKLATSATITKDPTKLEKMQLFAPKFINSEQLEIHVYDEETHKRQLARKEKKYTLPATLEEWQIVCDEEHKAEHLVGLLLTLIGNVSEGRKKGQQTIIFASSVSAAHRLRLLLQCLPSKPFSVRECSSLQSASERSQAVDDFRHEKAQVLVASDVATRGLDIPSVKYIGIYDVPVYGKSYRRIVWFVQMPFLVLNRFLSLLSQSRHMSIVLAALHVRERLVQCILCSHGSKRTTLGRCIQK